MPMFSTAQETFIHDRILESFNEFVSDEEGFEMVMGRKERVVTRLAGKRRGEVGEKREVRSESGERRKAWRRDREKERN